MIYEKKRVDSYRGLCRTEASKEVVGRLHIFLADYLQPKIQISLVKVIEILMYLAIFHFKTGLTQV